MKTILILLSITSGIFIPYGDKYTFLIRYFLMILLFFSFLDINVNKEIIRKRHFAILGITIAVSVLVFILISPFNVDLAQTAFITSIAPTAIAAPVIISLKRKKVEFVAFSLLLNNIVITLLIPFLLPVIMNSGQNISVGDVLMPVIIILTVPLTAAQLIKFTLPLIWKKLVELKDLSFYILIANVYIATSDASTYIRSNLNSKIEIIFLIAAMSAFLCVFFFTFGWFLGGKKYAHEASQSLGQKNNAFTIWLSLTYMNPISVLGPVFYVLFQNIYISWELYKHRHK